MQKSIKKVIAFLMAFAVCVSIITTGSMTALAADGAPSVEYAVHIQTTGDKQGYVKDGATAGTVGKSKRLEEIKIRVNGNKNLSVEYMTHIQSKGWETSWAKDNAPSGTRGQGKRLEAIRIKLSGTDADKYDIYYRVHAQTYGWLGWAKNGEPAGTAGQSKRLEGIQIKILPKGTYPTEGCLSASFVDLGKKPSKKAEGIVNYFTHVQTYGNQQEVCDGSVAGTFGESKRLEAITIRLDKSKLDIKGLTGDIEYRTHVQKDGWKPFVQGGQMSGTSKQSKRLEAIEIKLTGEVAKYYDVYYRVHAQTYGWLAWAKNGQTAGSAGSSKRLEGIQIVVVPKGSEAPNVLPAKTTQAFVSSTESGKKPTTEVQATALAIDMKTSKTMVVGTTDEVVATFTPEQTTNNRLVYKSSDESVATVDANGVVTAVKAGTAKITATTTDGSNKSAEVEVTVTGSLTKITVKDTKVDMTRGETSQIELTFTPAEYPDKSVTYKSSNEKVVTVSATGEMTAVGRGEAYVEIVSKVDEKVKTAVTKVTVKDAVVTKVTLNPGTTTKFKLTGDGAKIVEDLDDAVDKCKGQLTSLEGEDWTATDDDGNTYTVEYDGTSLTWKKNGTDVTSNIKKLLIDKQVEVTVPVTGQSNKAFEAVQKLQDNSDFAKNNKFYAYNIYVYGDNLVYRLSDLKLDRQYTSFKADKVETNSTVTTEPVREAFMDNNELYIVGDAAQYSFFADMAAHGLVTLTK